MRTLRNSALCLPQCIWFQAAMLSQTLARSTSTRVPVYNQVIPSILCLTGGSTVFGTCGDIQHMCQVCMSVVIHSGCSMKTSSSCRQFLRLSNCSIRSYSHAHRAEQGCCRRERRVNEAVKFAQETLSPLRGIMAHRSKEYDAMLHDTVALIAYEQPEVRQSAGAPLRIWFSTLLPVFCSYFRECAVHHC